MTSTSKTHQRRGGFTLVEILIASIVAVFVIGSVSTSLSHLGGVKSRSKLRLDAHLRADAALQAIRRDLVSVIRADDLFYTRLLILDDSMNVGGDFGHLDRDAILLFTNRIKAIRDIDFQGEGSEYETQYRIEVDDAGPVLWQRRDAVPDEYPRGGGMATPVVEGVLGMQFEAFDGIQWYEEWDSDVDGLPLAVRLTVTASGHRAGEDALEGPITTLRTVVPLTRVLVPADRLRRDEELDPLPELPGLGGDEFEDGEEGAEGVDGGGSESVPGGFSVPRDRGGRPGERDGGGRPGSGSGTGPSGGPGSGRPGDGPKRDPTPTFTPHTGSGGGNS